MIWGSSPLYCMLYSDIHQVISRKEYGWLGVLDANSTTYVGEPGSRDIIFYFHNNFLSNNGSKK